MKKIAVRINKAKKKPLRNTQRLVLIRDNKKLIVENTELKKTIFTLSSTADLLAQENAEALTKAFNSETSKLRTRLLKKSDRIKELEEDNERLTNDLSLRMPQHTEMYYLLNSILDSNVAHLSKRIDDAKVRLSELFPF